MTDTPRKIVVNCETGVTEEIDLTAQEIADMETARIQAEADRIEREAEATAKEAAKASAVTKLAALGLSADEVSALLN
jgi:hypothetical protein